MDAGIAALLGAAVGSLSTLGAAMVNGRSAARSQLDQWRRQHRRDAYAHCLAALHHRDIPMDDVLDALRSQGFLRECSGDRANRARHFARDVAYAPQRARKAWR
ncbi:MULTISPECIES: hypothetical protein [unclassified Streptomyces]|uniref:hypothetical protein n=1 Tax=unclassified Streptomyces TaxID=2593676 RepID=UPI001EF20229|nr:MULTISPECIES: hypothetical protein [unclassified Streptomyces]